MRRVRWVAVATVVGMAGLTACGGSDAETEQMLQDQAAEQPAPAETPTTEAPAGQEQVAGPPPEGATAEMVAQGRQIFTGKGNCYTCHGMDGEGTPLAPDQTNSDWINIDGSYESIIEVVRTGVAQPVEHPAPMPAMGGAQLSEDEIRAVSAYVYAISHG